jgi:hypothetical protein
MRDSHTGTRSSTPKFIDPRHDQAYQHRIPNAALQVRLRATACSHSAGGPIHEDAARHTALTQSRGSEESQGSPWRIPQFPFTMGRNDSLPTAQAVVAGIFKGSVAVGYLSVFFFARIGHEFIWIYQVVGWLGSVLLCQHCFGSIS